MRDWYFAERGPMERLRDSTLDAFFTSDTIGHPGEALIREGIQNSLDAAEGKGPVSVRIFISGNESAVLAENFKPYFIGAWEHFTACGNGISNIPSENAKCRFLVFEDFGTTGLQGDTAQTDDPEPDKNPFFYFFRAEGRSDKHDQDRGRWGIGKDVFLQASQVKAMFGVTVRFDDRKRLLMGQAVLKSHQVGQKQYLPDGWYGEQREGMPVMPVEDAATIEEFCRVFRLNRGDRPGLSIVVPWCDSEIQYKSLVEAVTRGYYYPILNGNLSVVVENPSNKLVIDSNSIRDILKQSKDDSSDQLRALLELATWARGNGGDQLPQLEPPSIKHGPKWTPSLVHKELRGVLEKSLNKGEPIGLRVPLFVRKKNSVSQQSHFDVYLKRMEQNDGRRRPEFIRRGLIIPDVHGASRLSGVCSLVIIEDDPLATLLGDAENPSHTRWENTSRLKNNYTYGNSYTTFVADSVNQLIRILYDAEKEDDKVLADFFSLPPHPEEPTVPGHEHEPGQKPGRWPPPPLPPIPPVLKKVRVQKIQGGFCVVPGDAPTPARFIDIRVAYDTRHGNPLNKYDPADFELVKTPIFAATEGLEIVRRASNQIVVKVQHPDFRLDVNGFDENRDLYVRAIAKEKLNGD